MTIRDSQPTTHDLVVAAIIEDGDCLLLTRRQKGVHLEGLWEFPGGKLDANETHANALRREILEELGTAVDVGDLILETTHSYPEKCVTLYFYRCRLTGAPTPQLGQEMRWVRRADLSALEFPSADQALIRMLSETEAP